MNWGLELWDQWDNVGSHSQKGITFLETYSHFIKDRCQVESEYARSLRRLVKTYAPKKKDDLDIQFTFVRAFRDVLNETGDFAGQHEMIAENLNSSIILELHTLIKEIKDERKKLLSEGSKMQQQLQQSLQMLEKAKKNYEKAYKEAEKAQENYLKADADYNLSRAEVEKQRNNATYKNQQCDDQKNEYANQLLITNQLQESHYGTLMPNVFLQLQELDEKRTSNFKLFIKKSVEVEHSVFPIINKCLDGVVQAADSIKESEDSELVIEKYKSGFSPPGDIPFDDLSTPRENGDITPLHPATRSETMKGTISASKLKKRVGLFGIFGGSSKTNTSFSEKDDFSELPPNQRRKKIQAKIAEVTNKLQQENKSREGLEKMKQVYTNNASLGDPETITGQLRDSTQTIDKLRAELHRYAAMLDEADRELHAARGTASGGPNTPTAAAFGRHATNGHMVTASSPRSSIASQRTSLSDESLSRSASDTSVCATSLLPPSATTTIHHPPPPISSSVVPSPHGGSSSSFLSPIAAGSHSHPHTTSIAAVNHRGKMSPASSTGSVSPAGSTSGGAGTTATVAITRTPLSTSSYHSNAPSQQASTPVGGSFLHSSRFSVPANNTFVNSSVAAPATAAAAADTITVPPPNSKQAVVMGGVAVGSSHSPESGIGLSHNSLHGSDSYDHADGPTDDQEEFYDIESQPVIGSCQAVYPFEGGGAGEGSMGMVEGEKLLLLEMDQGDGWSRVRRIDVSEEGFVPTSYLQIELNNDC